MNLKHLALIADGNRRWGRKHGKKMSADFYLDGSALGLDIVTRAFARGVPNVTLWIGSVSNLTGRSAIEIKALETAYREFFGNLDNFTFAHEQSVKVDVIGRWRELLSSGTVDVIERAITDTAQYAGSGKRMTVLIGYDGDDERGSAVQSLVRSDDPIPDDSKETAELLRQHSWTGHLPDVDLIIRTGSADDPHNSAGFLSLLADNTQYAFLETLWPDFTPAMLDKVIDEYSTRERRMGK